MKLLILTSLLLSSFSALGVEYQVKRYNGKILINDKPYSDQVILNNGDKVSAIGKKSFIQISYEDKSSYLIKNGEMILEKVETDESIVSLLRGGKFKSICSNITYPFLILR